MDVCIATAGAGGIAIAAVAGAAGGALDTAWEASNNGRDASAGEIIIGGVVGGSMNMLLALQVVKLDEQSAQKQNK